MKQLVMDKKILFTLTVHSVVDVITNSSSELFVGLNPSKEMLEAAIEAIYPNYLDEYMPLQSIDDLSVSELNTYFDFACSPNLFPAREEDYPILPGFTFDELYSKKSDKRAWNSQIQYELRNNNLNSEDIWHESFVTESNIEEIKNKLDPERHMFFMFSLNDNPDWDMQEKLEEFMIRYHLG